MKVVETILKNHVRNLSYKKIQTWYASLLKPRHADPPYKHVVQIGDPVLRAKADKIPIDQINSREVKFLIAKMKEVFKKFECLGLSAPQIGIPYQVFMMEFREKDIKTRVSSTERKLWEVEVVPFTVVINPEIKITDYKKLSFPEACESVKGFYAEVPRYRALELSGFDADGKPLHLKALGWTARIIQHEVDHLNGKLYTDVMDRKTLTCSCWEVINQRKGKVELPYGSG